MSANPLPWVILFVVVLASLLLKGYVKLPFGRKTASGPPASPPDLSKLDSQTLGYYFAQAKRREVEAKVANQVADDAARQIEEVFTGPFVKPVTPVGHAETGPR